MGFYERNCDCLCAESLNCNCAKISELKVRKSIITPLVKTETVESNNNLQLTGQNLILNSPNNVSVNSQTFTVNANTINESSVNEVINASNLLMLNATNIIATSTANQAFLANVITLSASTEVDLLSNNIEITSPSGTVSVSAADLVLNTSVIFANNQITYPGILNNVIGTFSSSLDGTITAITTATIGYSMQQGLFTLYNVQLVGPISSGSNVILTVPVENSIQTLSYQPQYVFSPIQLDIIPISVTAVVSEVTSTSSLITITFQTSLLQNEFYIPTLSISYIYATV